MRKHETTTTTTRHAASDAVRELRIALGKTQQTFAVEVMDTAISTIGRWESNDPPTGDALKRLEAIAQQNGLFELAFIFSDLHMKWLHEGVARMTLVPRTKDKREHGQMCTELEGSEEMLSGIGFLHALDGCRSVDPATQKKAKTLMAGLRKLGEELYGAPIIDKMDTAFVAAMAHGIPATAAEVKATVPQPKPAGKEKGRRRK